jgi:hypothetical protein
MLAGIAPIPAVLINSLSAAPRCTTLVSPVTMAIPASRGCRHAVDHGFQRLHRQPLFEDKTAGEIARIAPLTATSLAVPQTASLPILPPGKNRIDNVAVGGEGQPSPSR